MTDVSLLGAVLGLRPALLWRGKILGRPVSATWLDMKAQYYRLASQTGNIQPAKKAVSQFSTGPALSILCHAA
jgi:hypothetical protein